MIRDIQVEIRDTPDLHPDRAAALLNKLCALIGNVNAEIRDADAEYATTLLALLHQEEKANRAKIRGEITPEYFRKREARDTKELALHLIGSLKYFMRCQAEEMRLSK